MSVALLAILLVSCNNSPWFPNRKNYDVSQNDTTIASCVVEPQFVSITEVIDFWKDANEAAFVDSVFLSMNENVLRNVTNVLLKNHAFVTKKSIVEEYRANSSIYNNLIDTTPQTTNNKVDLGATDLGNRRSDSILSSSVNYRTDTINGHPVKIRIKTEESYVK